jgi:hypothetical protein
MGNEKDNRNKKDDNFIKKTSGEVNNVVGHTIDSAGNIVKNISGEGGLVGKATDTSGKILKGTANKLNDAIGKTSEAPGKFYKTASGHWKRKHGQNDDKKE